MRRLLSLLLCAACGWPDGLPTTAAPGPMPGGMAWPDPLRPAPAPAQTTEDAAVIVAIEDYARLADRPGARAMGAAWYRYFRGERGLEPWRITLLRDAEASPRAIARAVESARRRGRNGAVWVVFIGHVASSSPGAYGELWLAGGDGTDATIDAHAYPIERLLGRVGYGRHARAVVVLDGCLPGAPAPAISGTWTPETPRFLATGRPDRPRSSRWSSPSRVHREPADVAIYSAGLGPGCVERLPGADFPALSYLALGGLRGWADRDGNGNVGAVELLTQVTLMLRAAIPGPARPRPSLYGVDVPLARRVHVPAPAIAHLHAPGGEPPRERDLLAEPVAWTPETMVRFDRSSFVMGCPRRGDRECERDEKPTYRVRLSRFAVDRFEVTQAEYAACVAAGACTPIDPARCFVWTGESFDRGAAVPEPLTRPDHPAVCINYVQARAYCDALGKQLPTEAEWERAAAGTTRRRFPWGDAEPTCARAQFDGCGGFTRPVGRGPLGATPEGVHDLAGNVSEWVRDWYARDTYVRPLRSDPLGPEYGLVRVIRGGSYYDGASVLRSAYRYGLNPTSSFSTVGFRCAR